MYKLGQNSEPITPASAATLILPAIAGNVLGGVIGWRLARGKVARWVTMIGGVWIGGQVGAVAGVLMEAARNRATASETAGG